MALRDGKGFDDWSASYDQDTVDSQGYPFAGYRAVLATIATRATRPRSDRPMTILDVGIGTGKLSVPLYERGHHIIGIDFSTGMLDEARRRMPEAVLLEHDLRDGLPPALTGLEIDHAISSYCLHHFDLQHKVRLLGALASIIRATGRVIAGDVAFPSRVARDLCREAAGERWDDSETYLVADELQPLLTAAGMASTYTQVSNCAGVLEIEALRQP